MCRRFIIIVIIIKLVLLHKDYMKSYAYYDYNHIHFRISSILFASMKENLYYLSCRLESSQSQKMMVDWMNVTYFFSLIQSVRFKVNNNTALYSIQVCLLCCCSKMMEMENVVIVNWSAHGIAVVWWKMLWNFVWTFASSFSPKTA